MFEFIVFAIAMSAKVTMGAKDLRSGAWEIRCLLHVHAQYSVNLIRLFFCFLFVDEFLDTVCLEISDNLSPHTYCMVARIPYSEVI